MLKTAIDDDLVPPHPGEILREDLVPHMAISRTELARHLRISRKKLDDLLKERLPVTLELAQTLGVVVGYGTRYWLGLQMQHDLWRAERAPIRVAAPAGGRSGLVRPDVYRAS